MGMINKVVPAAELDNAVAGLACTLFDKPPAVLASGKRFFYRQIVQGGSGADHPPYAGRGCPRRRQRIHGQAQAELVGAMIDRPLRAATG